MTSSVLVMLEVDTPESYSGTVKSVWIYFEDVFYELEKVMRASRVDDAKGFVYTANGKFYRLVMTNLHNPEKDRSDVYYD